MSPVRTARARALTVALLAVSANGCHRETLVLGDGHARRDAAMDGSKIDAGEPDLEVPRFSHPVVIEALVGAGGADDDDPSLNHALTWIFFNSVRAGGSGGEDIWFSHRASPSDAWSTPELAGVLNSDARETGVALSADGLTIYFSSDRDGGAGGLDVYAATRATLQDPWSAPQAVDALNSSGDDLISALADGGTRALFARRDNGTTYHLWWAHRDDGAEPWSVPEPIDELDSDSGEADPFLVSDGTQLLFTREGDLHLARRSGHDAPFGDGQALSTLNSDGEDTDAWADADLSYVVFASDRTGEHRLYEAWREPAP